MVRVKAEQFTDLVHLTSTLSDVVYRQLLGVEESENVKVKAKVLPTRLGSLEENATVNEFSAFFVIAAKLNGVVVNFGLIVA